MHLWHIRHCVFEKGVLHNLLWWSTFNNCRHDVMLQHFFYLNLSKGQGVSAGASNVCVNMTTYSLSKILKHQSKSSAETFQPCHLALFDHTALTRYNKSIKYWFFETEINIKRLANRKISTVDIWTTVLALEFEFIGEWFIDLNDLWY